LLSDSASALVSVLFWLLISLVAPSCVNSGHCHEPG
jgi:hypothetical protein